MSIKLFIKQQGVAAHQQPPEEKTFEGPLVTIGSDQSASLCLSGSGIAQEQAVLISESNQWLLINRAEGTALNDEPLAREARRPLVEGDKLLIGNHLISCAFKEPRTGHAQASAETSAQADQQTFQTPSEPQSLSPENPSTPRLSAPSSSKESARPSFAKILESLRTVEDSFYFMVQGGAQSGRRVAIESTVMLLGWDQTGQAISFEAATITNACAVVRKDWNGVVAQPLSADSLMVNEMPITTEQRLADGDRLRLLSRSSAATAQAQDAPFLIFHEPAMLAPFNTLYQPKQETEPETLAPVEPAETFDSARTSAPPLNEAVAVAAPVKFPRAQRKYFGYFTLLELLTMCVCTLVAAVIFFLVLLYLKPVR